MKFIEPYGAVVATIEQSSGNECVGSMWTETKIWSPHTPIKEIIEWASNNHCSGRLIITIGE